MFGFDTNEDLAPCKDPRGSGEYGAILFDVRKLPHAQIRWFIPEQWNGAAHPITGSGRGGAWRLDTERGSCCLRQYLRGGWVARVTRERYLWRGIARVRSFAEFRLLRELKKHGLPVPAPLAACYLRTRLSYRAWIVLEWLPDTQSLAARTGDALAAGDAAPALWGAVGTVIARFHRAGLDHADLNAHNILLDAQGKLWLIDFDRSRLRIPDTGWRQRNLARLRRSLLKIHGKQHAAAIKDGFKLLRQSYETYWARGL